MLNKENIKKVRKEKEERIRTKQKKNILHVFNHNKTQSYAVKSEPSPQLAFRFEEEPQLNSFTPKQDEFSINQRFLLSSFSCFSTLPHNHCHISNLYPIHSLHQVDNTYHQTPVAENQHGEPTEEPKIIIHNPTYKETAV
jgi:hypothetical protein